MICYDLKTLREAYCSGESCRFLFFWGHTPPADGHVNESCLSQWWMCRFTADGVEYNCAEQYMMAEKARMFGDSEMLEKIMASNFPKEMKAYGRAVRNFDQAVWDSRCYERVLAGNLAKFEQNADLREFLAGTRGAYPGGGKPARPDLGHWYGKAKSQRPKSDALARQKSFRVRTDRSARAFTAAIGGCFYERGALSGVRPCGRGASGAACRLFFL